MRKINISGGLSVSAIALGAMNFGTSTQKDEAFNILDKYLDFGGNFIDTSNNYAHWQGTGDESETLLGEWFKKSGKRERVVLATKVGFDRHGVGAGLKKEQIEFWVDQSLRKLQTDYIDLYYAHTDDMNTPIEETLETFDNLVKKGKVRVLGASNFDTWRIAESNMLAKSKGQTQYTVVQQKFSYLTPKFGCAPKYTFNEHVNRERLRFLKEKDIPLVAYSCLCKGGYENVSRLPNDYELSGRYQAIKDMAKEKGLSVSAMVLSYLMSLSKLENYPQIIPLFSSSEKHVLENLRSTQLELDIEELQFLNSIE